MDPIELPTPSPPPRRRLNSLHRAGMYLFLAVACFYLASMSQEVAWGDARPIYEVAESMLGGDGIGVATRWPSDAPQGKANKFYAAQPWLTSLVHIPGAGIRQLMVHLKPSPEFAHLLSAFACHLAGALLGGLTALLFFRLCLAHGASRRLARYLALILAFASIVWVYARSPFSEMAQITAFTGFFLALTTHLRTPGRRTALIVGLCAGALLNSKYIYALCLPGTAILMAWVERKTPRRIPAHALFCLLGLLPGIAMALLYNHLRFGSPWSSGYQVIGQVMVENPWLGLWGFFLSPGKSIFLYVPPLAMAVAGLPAFYRSHRLSTIAMALTILPVLYFYARFPSWPGDWAWGPRYAVFMVPTLLLPLVSFLADARFGKRALAIALVGAGLLVQLLGNAFYWDHFIRIAAEVRTQWLGAPNRRGAITADKGGFCEGCFEDTYPSVWLPPLQPIVGHAWLFRHVAFKHDAMKAMEDAPWRRHTKLPLELTNVYARVRVDHFAYAMPLHTKTAATLNLVLTGLGGLFIARFIRHSRDENNPPPALPEA